MPNVSPFHDWKIADATPTRNQTVGVLALQGDFSEHIKILRLFGVNAIEIRKPEQLRDLNGLIMPGGESTTFAKLADAFGLIEPLRAFCESGKPVCGTCAGMIFLAKDIGRAQPTLGVMDIKVKRNAFGRQLESFEMDLQIPALAQIGANGTNQPFHAIFIRAPLIESVGKSVEVLAKLSDETIVAARQNNLLATSFHPELTRDPRLHRYFLRMISKGVA
ncbi:MAG: pyridoxal 5'-phosphate synthase glutaminase subunit PdxT [Chloroflexi bacterium]|nr:pyridoxal 5'-phosphate synthase glutaminase subunit PdxT [Chloroflexota bacterium]